MQDNSTLSVGRRGFFRTTVGGSFGLIPLADVKRSLEQSISSAAAMLRAVIEATCRSATEGCSRGCRRPSITCAVMWRAERSGQPPEGPRSSAR